MACYTAQKHWSAEQTMMEYIHNNNIMKLVRELKQDDSASALVIMHSFKEQVTEDSDYQEDSDDENSNEDNAGNDEEEFSDNADEPKSVGHPDKIIINIVSYTILRYLH